MTKETADIKDLEALLGHTKAPYRAMHHTGALPGHATQRRPLYRRPVFAIAASTVLVAGLGAVMMAGFEASGSIPSSRLAISSSISGVSPPAATIDFGAGSLSRPPQLPGGFRMPTRPVASSG
ncbi:MAG: hypothetical protein AAF940_02135 [Pseudomonadota bacterium]